MACLASAIPAGFGCAIRRKPPLDSRKRGYLFTFLYIYAHLLQTDDDRRGVRAVVRLLYFYPTLWLTHVTD